MEQELGEATIVYESPEDDEPTEMRVENEHVVYFQDHWMVKTGEDDDGNDRVRRIPAKRVYHVDRSVEKFEDEAATTLDRLESLASKGDLDRVQSAVDDLKQKVSDE